MLRCRWLSQIKPKHEVDFDKPGTEPREDTKICSQENGLCGTGCVGLSTCVLVSVYHFSKRGSLQATLTLALTCPSLVCFFFNIMLRVCFLCFVFRQGAVYGILAAKISDQSEDDPYSFQAYLIILPWVSKRDKLTVSWRYSKLLDRRWLCDFFTCTDLRRAPDVCFSSFFVGCNLNLV